MKHDTSTGVGWEGVRFLELVLLCLPFVGLLLVGRSVANMLTGGLDRGHRLFLCLPSSKLLAQRPWRWLHQVRPHTCISASSGAANILTTSVHTIVSPTCFSLLQICVLAAFTLIFFCIPFVARRPENEKSIPRCEMNRLSESYKTGRWQNLGSYGKTRIFGPKTNFSDPKKRPLLDTNF